MKKLTLLLSDSHSNDSSWTPQSCADALAPLLEINDSDTLDQSQLDAIRYLVSTASEDRISTSIRTPKSNHTTYQRHTGFRKKTKEKFTAALKEAFCHDHDDERTSDQHMSSTFTEVFHSFGGEKTVYNICFQTKTNVTKVISSRVGRRSGKRLNLLLDNYTCNGHRSLNENLDSGASVDTIDEDSADINKSCPPEWNAMTTETKVKLANLLSWENLAKWDFNILEVSSLTSDCLLFVGWALLCEPMAQEAMAMDLSLEVNGTTNIESYNFPHHVDINPQAICNFLRQIESMYKEVPYHSHIHAADVTQTTHCLIQLMGGEYTGGHIWDPLTIFSLLLAATFHDVGHSGTNNLFEQNAMTPLAIRYNDVSVLENMHSAIGHSLLLGEEKRDEWDIFKNWSGSDKIQARRIMKSVILGTDMSHHFTQMEELHSLISKVQKLENDAPNGLVEGGKPILSILSDALEKSEIPEECSQLADSIIKFVLHAADISNAAKPEDLAKYWADGALNEFFAQGDKEKKSGLPVSPLCDRDTVKKSDSQIGFIKFVVQPTFDLVGEIIPKVNEVVKPQISKNLGYWTREKTSLLE